MGIKAEEKPWMIEGREAHAIIQAHVSGKKLDDRIKHITFTFPIVEEIDFDPRCKFSFEAHGYEIIGFFDGLDEENKRFLEIKTGGTPWTISQYMKSYQRKLYALAKPHYVESILITGRRDPKTWFNERLKVYKLSLDEKDRKEADEWIVGAIKILEEGNFTRDLIDGKCTDDFCPWGNNCHFK